MNCSMCAACRFKSDWKLEAWTNRANAMAHFCYPCAQKIRTGKFHANGWKEMNITFTMITWE